MTYRSLLVLLDRDPLCAARTQFAIRLARTLNCHLQGLAPTGGVSLPRSVGRVAAIAEFAGAAREKLREDAEQAVQRFRDECRSAELASFDATVEASDVAAALVRAARYSDLSILSQANPRDDDYGAAQAVVEQTVLYSARPTLILPEAGRFDDTGSRAMVSWDDSREAARAVSDALPLLRLARHVEVLSWDESRNASHDTLRRSLVEVQRWLARHDVKAEVRLEPIGIEIADAMLSRAADLGVGLIVMGAYGHARWAQRMLGGATRGLLESMTAPVLMSR